MKLNTREFIQHLSTILEKHHGFKKGEFVQGKRRFQVRQDSYQNEPTIYLLYMPQDTLIEYSEHCRQRISVETNLDIVAQQIADKITNILIEESTMKKPTEKAINKALETIVKDEGH